jgi:hypothetical protein
MGIDPDLEPIIADLKQADSDLADGLAGHSKKLSELTIAVEQLGVRITELANKPVTPPPVVTPPTGTWTPKFPGDTQPGKIRWGCSYNSNGVPTPHETAAGVPVGVRRTFWQLGQASSLLSTVKADHAAGRVPWVSIKLSDSWKNTAAGSLDTQLTALFNNLKATGKTVWFTAHHEPEGGNGTAFPDEGQDTEGDWRAMQVRVRTLLNGTGANANVAFASCLMAWTWDSRSGRNPADWWVPNTWDFAGIDHYVEASSTELMTPMWKNTLAFYKSKNLKIALGEWGNKDHTSTGAAEMQAWYDHLRSESVIGACYFDTSLNGGVPLSGAVLTKFHELMKAPTSIRIGG